MRSITTAATAMAVAIQQAHAVLVQVVQRVPQQIVLQQVVHTTVMAQPVLATLVAAAVVKLVIQLTVWGLASKTLYIQIGLLMGSVMMVHTSLQIMAMAVPQALQFISTAMSSSAMAAIANAVAAVVALQVKSKIAMVIVAQKRGLPMVIATMVPTNGMVFQFT
jgi:hypothetical protein